MSSDKADMPIITRNRTQDRSEVAKKAFREAMGNPPRDDRAYVDDDRDAEPANLEALPPDLAVPKLRLARWRQIARDHEMELGELIHNAVLQFAEGSHDE